MAEQKTQLRSFWLTIYCRKFHLLITCFTSKDQYESDGAFDRWRILAAPCYKTNSNHKKKMIYRKLWAGNISQLHKTYEFWDQRQQKDPVSMPECQPSHVWCSDSNQQSIRIFCTWLHPDLSSWVSRRVSISANLWNPQIIRQPTTTTNTGKHYLHKVCDHICQVR